MKKENLLKYCRYYKGEEECPFKEQNERMLWHYEMSWVHDMMNENMFIPVYLDEYIRLQMGDFEESDNVPLSLKALLFNRFAKGCQSLAEAVEPFKEFYVKYYRKGGA